MVAGKYLEHRQVIQIIIKITNAEPSKKERRLILRRSKNIMKKYLTNFALIISLAASVSTVAVAQEQNLKAEFNAKQAAAKKVVWAGTWKYNSRYAPVMVKITKVNAKNFKFEMDASTGANIGNISGMAKIKGNKAYFDDMVPEMNDAEGGFGCELLFVNSGASMEVKQTTECNQYGGAGVSFERAKLLPGNPPYIETDFTDHEVFPNKAADAEFKRLVGVKDYDNFLNAFHLVTEGDAVDTDTGAKYFNGCVRGMCTYSAAIIMLDGKGHYWGAVTVDATGDTQAIHYYSNVPKWTGKMPAAIADWAKDIKANVVYKNKK